MSESKTPEPLAEPMPPQALVACLDFRRYCAKVAGTLVLAAGLKPSEVDEDDIIQTVAMRILNSKYQIIEQPRAFISLVTQCVVKDARKMSARWGSARRADVDPDYLPSETPSHKEPAGDGILELALNSAPSKMAEVARRHFLGGATGAVIAEVLGMNVRTVNAHLYHFLSHARRGVAPTRETDFRRVETARQFVDSVAHLQYSYETGVDIAAVFGACRDEGHRSRLAGLCAEATLLVWDKSSPTASVLADALSKQRRPWECEGKVIDELERRALKAIDAGDCGRISCVEPLSFALAHFPDRERAHRQMLDRRMRDRDWQAADAAREKGFYDTTEKELGRISHHTFNSGRVGLQQASDAGRLLTIARLHRYRPGSAGRAEILPLLKQHVAILDHNGEPGLAALVQGVIDVKDNHRA